jgi:hypothetical protein
VRLTGVVHQEDGEWKAVQNHASIGVPNEHMLDPMFQTTGGLATTTHAGPHDDIDRTYGAPATYVAEHALSVEGPIREYYLIDRHTTDDESKWRTQIGWPIFRTAQPA